jgi:hypothetical protein
MAEVVDRIDALLERLERLDARRRESPGQLGLDFTGGSKGPGGGEPCGNSWISPDKECHKNGGPGAAEKPASRFMQLAKATQERKAREAAERQRQQEASRAAAKKSKITLAEGSDEPLFEGLKPTRSLGSGAFGKTYQFDTDDGPVVVKVNSLVMGDPAETDPQVGLAEQRENLARRELRNLQRAHEEGLGPEPIGEATQLPDGRWSIAYTMLPGSKLTANHMSLDLTPEAESILADPNAAARYVAGALQLARRQADSGLIHGDLHGGNILVGPDGTPSLIDWAMTTEARNPWNQSERSAALRAMDESYGLTPLLQFAGKLDIATEEGKISVPYTKRARAAEKAYKAVVDAHDFAWEEANNEKVGAKLESGEFRRRLTEANRLKRDEGMPYDMALRDPRVGLEPPLTPEVLARAAAARDAIFGQSDLEQMRRELDQRFGRLT